MTLRLILPLHLKSYICNCNIKVTQYILRRLNETYFEVSLSGSLFLLRQLALALLQGCQLNVSCTPFRAFICVFGSHSPKFSFSSFIAHDPTWSTCTTFIHYEHRITHLGNSNLLLTWIIRIKILCQWLVSGHKWTVSLGAKS